MTDSDKPQTKFRRAKSATFSFLFCLAVVVGALWCIWLANKPTNPYHPWFNPYHFKFDDYFGSECTMREALAKTLPVGVSRTFVEKVLVRSGGARIHEENPSLVHYSKKSIFPAIDAFWNVTVHYDDAGNVRDITLPGGFTNNSAYQYQEFCKFGKTYGTGKRWK